MSLDWGKLIWDKFLGQVLYQDGDYFAVDLNHAKTFSPASNPVRQKFNGYVNFHFNGDINIPGLNDQDLQGKQIVLSSLVKTAEVPSAEIKTDVKNQYNKKRITVTHAEYKPISLTAYDTVDSAWVIILMRMYAHLFSNPLGQHEVDGNGRPTPKKIPYDVVPQKVPTGNSSGPTYGFNLTYSDNNMGYNIRPGNEKYFISHIDIVHYHAQRAIKYTMYNPIVTSFTVDGFDHADSQPVMINMNIEYENFSISPVINGFIPEEDMKRFVRYGSEEVYKRLRSTGPLDRGDNPGGQMASKDTRQQPALKERKLDFLAPNTAGDASNSSDKLITDQSQSDFWSGFQP